MPTSLGPAEILVILIVALIVLGPKRLPEAGRQVGKALAEVRRWTTDVKSEIKSVIDVEVPMASTVVEPVVVSGASTSVETKVEASASDVVQPVTIAVDEPGIAIPPDTAAVPPAAPSPAEEAVAAGAAVAAPDHDEPDMGPGPTAVEQPESPPGDPARL